MSIYEYERSMKSMKYEVQVSMNTNPLWTVDRRQEKGLFGSIFEFTFSGTKVFFAS